MSSKVPKDDKRLDLRKWDIPHSSQILPQLLRRGIGRPRLAWKYER
jgi:hypothetical protein